MVIKWSDFAISNLQDFVEYSKLSSPKSYAENLTNNVYTLENNPRAGKKLYYDGDEEIRQLVFKMHRIIYRIFNDEIHVLMVLNSNQDLQTTLKFIDKFLK